VEGAVRTVLLNRPDKRNALDTEMIAELQAAFTKPPAAEERVAVVRAAGSVFCAGLDMKERSERPQGASPIEAMLLAIEVYPLPVVAVVQGDAIAGGNELAMHCDLVVARQSPRASACRSPRSAWRPAGSWPRSSWRWRPRSPRAHPAAGRSAARRSASMSLGAISHIAEPGRSRGACAGAVIERLADNAPLVAQGP
jgi:hypothetical protein